MNSSLGGVDATQSYHGYNYTNDSYKNPGDLDLGGIALMGLTLITCYVGLVGNGYIIWLLGFQIKRNCFTTFILNLAVADFGYLVLIFIYYIYSFFANFEENKIFHHFCSYFVQVMYVNANFLLTAISIDRCVAVLFPIWHHCSRPKHLTSSVCLVLFNNMINLLLGTILLSCLNSSINPVIYFLVGRKGGAQFKVNLKAILQNAFKESEATGGR
ncbi:mas-related G-protein coupled receptor member X2-like [Thamnophis elegans]|uniref:mas-related G-protein coupled receptor member X2-like n=1 Tax=Thamnophis elegans TaxID=35005 RepID=UPI001377A334|nr:mas-related G-protein coupled receptor member X2-like [Thamnophis elegans]